MFYLHQQQQDKYQTLACFNKDIHPVRRCLYIYLFDFDRLFLDIQSNQCYIHHHNHDNRFFVFVFVIFFYHRIKEYDDDEG